MCPFTLQWTELNRILDRDGAGHHHHDCSECGLPSSPTSSQNPKLKGGSSWSDVWRLYEDVCVICAGLWMGTWRSNSRSSYTSVNGNQWGQAREEGDQDLSIDGTYVRNVGMGIEGRPSVQPSSNDTGGLGGIGNNGSGLGIGNGASPSVARVGMRVMRRSSGTSAWSAGRSTLRGNAPEPSSASSKYKMSTAATVREDEDEGEGEDGFVPGGLDPHEGAERQLRTTLALLQTFHAHTCFQLSTLASLLPPKSAIEGGRTVVLTPKDILSFELGPLSTLDARFVEWLAEEYAGDTNVVIKRGWKDLLGMVFGLS
jgi:hypothetical protein